MPRRRPRRWPAARCSRRSDGRHGDRPASKPGGGARAQAGRRRKLPGGAPVAARANENGSSSRWIRFRALDEIETTATAFDWEARFGPLSCLKVVDRLSSEAAASELRFLSFRLSGAPADETALRKGQIMRYLAELAWAPDAILRNWSLEWQVREDGFRVSHPSAHRRISVEIQLDEAGRIGSVSAKDRPRMETGRFVDRPWRGSFEDYRLHNGRWIPFRGEALRPPNQAPTSASRIVSRTHWATSRKTWSPN
ncbi:DUF6544 family protein [Bradyrhizobium sp. RDM4]|uniref:DUF6544 family protein n=1 Tax=Bradyrhizobium sp. RDM4 TaxID=3378765 RepID=UPI0038FC5E69